MSLGASAKPYPGMSTSRRRIGCPTSNKLSSCVRPGVFDVRASLLRLVSALSSELLPTFERPANAISGDVGVGQELQLGRRFQKLDRSGEQLARALFEFGVGGGLAHVLGTG